MTRHPFVQRFDARAAQIAGLRCRAVLRIAVCALLAFVVARARPALAQISNDQTGQVIPGTQGITLGPGVDLSGWNTVGHQLEFAALVNTGLTGASFANSDLTSATFYQSILTNSNFDNANLANANFRWTDLTSANLTQATVAGASFSRSNLTAPQLYSTASYQSQNLQGISFYNPYDGPYGGPGQPVIGYDMMNWNFAGQDLTAANLAFATLINATLINATLTNAYLYGSTLTNADLTGATVAGADFEESNLTGPQLYMTASYRARNLQSVSLSNNDLTGWDFSGQSLSNANLSASTLTNADLRGATLANADLSGSTLTNADLTGATLNNANLSGSMLTNADLSGATLTNTNFSGSTLTKANLAAAIVAGADFGGSNLTASQLYTTASYQARNLPGIGLEGAGRSSYDDLTGWNFSGQNLTNAGFVHATLTDADFTGADLRGATGWTPDPTTNTHDTIQPDGSIQGLMLLAGENLIIRNNPIAITVDTSASIDNAATLQFLLDDNWTSPVGFSAGLTPTVGGTLELEFAAGVDPADLLGESFQLFDWNAPLPEDDQFATITTEPGLTFDLSNLYSTGTVTLTAVPEPSSLALCLLVLGALPLLALRRKRAL